MNASASRYRHDVVVAVKRCFACDRIVGATPKLVDTRDGQTVYVGVECYRRVKAAGKKGYQPPQGGPVLWLLEVLA